MSMMGYVDALMVAQIQAFRAEPTLASDRAKTSVDDLFVDRRAMTPQRTRDQYDASRRDLVAALGRDPDAELAAGRERLKPLRPFEPILELGGDWHVIHYLLTGHADAALAPGDALLTGEGLGDELGYGPARLHDARETLAFADVLAATDGDRLVARMDFAQMVRLRIYPLFEVPDGANAAEWRAEIRTCFPRLQEYVRSAAHRGDGLLIWLA